MKKLIITSSFLLLFALSFSQVDFRDSNAPLDDRIESLMRQLTLEEKLGFLEHSNLPVERLGIPAYSWWNEALHGVARNGFATVYPMPVALAATFDEKAVYEMFMMIGDEARMKYLESQKKGQYGDNTGLTFFTPNINIFRDPRWGRGMETYGEDPYLTARMGAACVNGLQQKVGQYYKTLACVKHFAVHSGPEADRHSFNATVSGRDLWTTYLPAFEYIVNNTDVSMVMCGYNRLNGEPCCTNNSLLINVLQRKWGYDRLFVTDCWALNDCWERDTVIPRHETHATAADAAAAAFGSVIDLECGSGLNALKDAVNQGLVDTNQLNLHVYKVLRARFELGMFDQIQPFGRSVENTFFDKKALEMAQKSIVLLKNNGILPLDIGKFRNIAVIGPNAGDSVMLSGNYNGTPRGTTTIYKGILQYINTLPKEIRPNLYFDTACHHADFDYKAPRDFEIQIKKCDLVIFAGGLSPELEGEQLDVEIKGFHGGDRTDINLPEVQRNMLMRIKELGKPVVFVLCSGGAVALDWEDRNLDAIMEAWYGGQAAGTAVADVLFGKVNPSGKLPVTFYSSNNYLPPFENYDMEGRTYRFMKEKPLYPFGYGLSYTKFSYSNLKFDKDHKFIKFLVTNVGDRPGAEVVQVYLTNKSDAKSPVKTLVGFRRVELQPGESKGVGFRIDDKFFDTYIDEYQTFTKVPATFVIQYGDQTMEVEM